VIEAAKEGTTSRYEALVRIGTGGMATVFVGRALGAAGFSRLVALKRIHPHLRDDPAASASLAVEARVASCLRHANVVGVLDIEDDAGDLVVALDYVEGCTLVELSRADAVTPSTAGDPREIVRVLLDAASGLHAAHRASDEAGRPLGLVHRDVSPSNVLVGVDGVARISDFGIAKGVGADHVTTSGVLKGKLGYMAPEYVEGRLADARSDQFSFGVVAWEALARRRLFKGANEVETFKSILRADVPPLDALDARLAPLAPVIARALSRRPEARYASVGELARDLEARARATDLVSSHAEVAALVERVVGPELLERRRRLTAALDASLSTSGDRAPRDLVATAAVPQPEHLPTATIVGRDLVATAAVAQPERLPTGTVVHPRGSATQTSARPPTAGERELVPTTFARREEAAPPPASHHEDLPPRRRALKPMALALGGAGAVVLGGLGVGMLTGDDARPATAPLAVETAAAPPMRGESSATLSAPPPSSTPAPSPSAAPTPPSAARAPGQAPPRLVPTKAPPNPYGKTP
jgi:eukaryotic-like serine/threonine-protein kinase